MPVCVPLALFLVSTVLPGGLARHVLAPSTVLTATWTGMVGLVVLDATLYHFFSVQVSSFAYLVHDLSLLAFLIGAATIQLGWARAKRPEPLECADEGPAPRILFHLALWQWLVLVMLVGFKLAIVTVRYGNILSSLGQIRSDFVAGRLTFPAFSGFTTLLANLAILNLGILIALKRTFAATFLAAATIVAAFLDDLTTADKGGLRLLVLLVLVAYYAVTIRRGMRWSARAVVVWSAVAVAGLALFSLITFWRAPGTRSISDVTYQHLYGDIVGNLVSSSWFLEHPLPSSVPGENSFHGLYALFAGIAGDLSGQPVYTNPYSRTDPIYYANIVRRGVYNTTDYVAYLYADFGIVGVVLLSYAWGIAATVAFLRALRGRRTEEIQVLALVTVGIVVSVRGFYYGAVGFWLTLLCVYGQGLLVRAVRDHTDRERMVRAH